MPRDGSGIYTQPLPDVVSSTTISSTVYNAFVNDVEQDLNAVRPVLAGGTGSSSLATLLYNIGAEKAAQVVTNYDTHLWIPGSFYSADTASGEPVDGHAFSGVAYIGEALADPPTNANVVVEARDATDGKLYIRRKNAGVWTSWQLDGDLSGVNAAIAAVAAGVTTLDTEKVDKAGDTMTGYLVLHANPDANMKAATKQYVDTQVATAVDPTELTTSINAEITRADGAYQAKDAQLFAGIPVSEPSFPYGLVLTDAQKCIKGIGTVTIPANASVAFPIGTCITFLAYGGTITIAITSDTLYWNNGTAQSGTRTLGNVGIATAVKVTSTVWVISGSGLT
jgi:hypothetical protein